MSLNLSRDRFGMAVCILCCVLRLLILPLRISSKLPKTLPKAIPFEDIKKFLAVIDNDRDRALFLMLLHTGIRIGELLNGGKDDDKNTFTHYRSVSGLDFRLLGG